MVPAKGVCSSRCRSNAEKWFSGRLFVQSRMYEYCCHRHVGTPECYTYSSEKLGCVSPSRGLKQTYSVDLLLVLAISYSSSTARSRSAKCSDQIRHIVVVELWYIQQDLAKNSKGLAVRCTCTAPCTSSWTCLVPKMSDYRQNKHAKCR